MIVVPLLMNFWTMMATMVIGGIALAFLDRTVTLGRLPLGLIVLVCLIVEEMALIVHAHINGDTKALGLVFPLALFFVALAVVYGMTKAAFFAWPKRSKAP